MNAAPSSERIHISFFGMRNAGKSSVMNRVIGQELSIVSSKKGTTTDPVRKSMELLPIGPVVMIDTPGLDDEGELGELRIRKAKRELVRTDAAVVVAEAGERLNDLLINLINTIRNRNIPYVICVNKIDTAANTEGILKDLENLGIGRESISLVSAITGEGINDLKKSIAKAIGTEEARPIVRDLFSPGDTVMLVIPVDKAAPKGRLILPQQQSIRDILDGDGRVLAVKEGDVASSLSLLSAPPRLVITDSQAFGTVAKQVPESIPLTSFSILFARYKGNLESAVKGISQLRKLKGGESILISEGCTHHRQCGDIGTVKIPRWIKEYTGKEFEYSFSSGTEFTENPEKYSLIIHCGGCMLTEREMRYRYREAEESGTAITNYGILIAAVHGILPRSLSLFPDILSYLQR